MPRGQGTNRCRYPVQVCLQALIGSARDLIVDGKINVACVQIEVLATAEVVPRYGNPETRNVQPPCKTKRPDGLAPRPSQHLAVYGYNGDRGSSACVQNGNESPNVEIQRFETRFIHRIAR